MVKRENVLQSNQKLEIHLTTQAPNFSTDADLEENYRKILSDVEYEEVTLRRSLCNEKLGLTLCYGSGENEDTDIFVSEIEANSIVDKDGRIKFGDQILQINGIDVHTRNQAIELFCGKNSDIKLLLARTSLLHNDCSIEEEYGFMLPETVFEESFEGGEPSEDQPIMTNDLLTNDDGRISQESSHGKDSGISRNTDSDPELPPPVMSTSPSKFSQNSPVSTTGSNKSSSSGRSSNKSSNDHHQKNLSTTENSRTKKVTRESESNLESELTNLHREMELIQLECDRLIEQHAVAERNVRQQLVKAQQLSETVDQHMLTRNVSIENCDDTGAMPKNVMKSHAPNFSKWQDKTCGCDLKGAISNDGAAIVNRSINGDEISTNRWPTDIPKLTNQKRTFLVQPSDTYATIDDLQPNNDGKHDSAVFTLPKPTVELSQQGRHGGATSRGKAPQGCSGARECPVSVGEVDADFLDSASFVAQCSATAAVWNSRRRLRRRVVDGGRKLGERRAEGGSPETADAATPRIIPKPTDFDEFCRNFGAANITAARIPPNFSKTHSEARHEDASDAPAPPSQWNCHTSPHYCTNFVASSSGDAAATPVNLWKYSGVTSSPTSGRTPGQDQTVSPRQNEAASFSTQASPRCREPSGGTLAAIHRQTTKVSDWPETIYSQPAQHQQQHLLRQAMVQQATRLMHVNSLNRCQQGQSDGSAKLEWKVKRRSDGSRYITRRPMRNRLLKERAEQLCSERVGASTDDDAMSELKIGRYWSKDQRKKHVERQKERKRRQIEVVIRRNEQMSKLTSDQPIVHLSHKKMLRRQGAQLFDKFTTVQEVLVHGAKISQGGGRFLGGLLSVTAV